MPLNNQPEMAAGTPAGPAPGMVTRCLREPLLHFVAAGALLFLVSFMQAEPAPPSEASIRIDAAEIARLEARWSAQQQRRLAPEELEELIEARVREEVLYREALAMGLDRDDDVLRRHLAQKLQFLIEDLAALREPAEAELVAFLEARPDQYRLPAHVSFSQVHFSPDRRGPAAEVDARRALAELQAAVQAEAPADMGDPFLMGHAFETQSAEEVASLFGQGFAEAVLGLEPGRWAGPITSGYGWHLVRVAELSPGRLPALAEVEERVRQDWAYHERRKANEEVFARLLSRYEVTIEDGAQPPAAMAGLEDGAGTRP